MALPGFRWALMLAPIGANSTNGAGHIFHITNTIQRDCLFGANGMPHWRYEFNPADAVWRSDRLVSMVLIAKLPAGTGAALGEQAAEIDRIVGSVPLVQDDKAWTLAGVAYWRRWRRSAQVGVHSARSRRWCIAASWRRKSSYLGTRGEDLAGHGRDS
ncbi:hypothetical protein BV25DRAFT_1913296 [Artomyces pyxidatus]|uniref:Uncharacterized protein n=1 Tax=Artomyces pyxidatus TaxID=48021 RepID=A0ACB8TBH7_9AGAM|nr:hypothetical protein BV25DRAFT_1913296 [Artomyces pyxidatus]